MDDGLVPREDWWQTVYMATKKNKQRKKTKSKKVVSKKATPKKKPTRKKKTAPKKTIAKRAPSKNTTPKRATLEKKRVRGKNQRVSTVAFEPEGLSARSGGQSGDLQGLSSIASADSESVDELIEEGNSFEAEVVKGVQDAPDADESEVVTHEVPEEGFPKKTLDKR